MSIRSVRICSFKSEPDERECLEAVWSQGSACKTCASDCYRKGWKKSLVDADNRKLVRRRNENT